MTPFQSEIGNIWIRHWADNESIAVLPSKDCGSMKEQNRWICNKFFLKKDIKTEEFLQRYNEPPLNSCDILNNI